ncbi:MAG: glycosyltransferase family 4 protein [bacterium]
MHQRVIFVSHSVRLYGASRSLLALLEGFRQHAIDTCTILPGTGLMQDALAARGLASAIVPFPCWVAHETEPADVHALRAAQARAVPALVDVIEAWRPDVVWSNASVTAVGALAAAALGLPHIWHLREVSGDAYPFRFIEGTAAAAALLHTAQARIAVSAAVGAAYEALGSGPCSVIYNGVGDAAALVARSTLRPRQGRLRMLLPGRVREDKGQLAAIEATQRLITAGHDVELRIVGDGESLLCEDAIARLGLRDAVTLTGIVADLEAEYRQADMALACSTIEGMGRTTAEAMSYGLPVVGFRGLGTTEMIEHDVTGLLCDASAAALARAVEGLVMQPDVARRLGDRARLAAQRRFSNEQYTRASLDVLRRVAPPATLAAECEAVRLS